VGALLVALVSAPVAVAQANYFRALVEQGDPSLALAAASQDFTSSLLEDHTSWVWLTGVGLTLTLVCFVQLSQVELRRLLRLGCRSGCWGMIVLSLVFALLGGESELRKHPEVEVALVVAVGVLFVGALLLVIYRLCDAVEAKLFGAPEPPRRRRPEPSAKRGAAALLLLVVIVFTFRGSLLMAHRLLRPSLEDALHLATPGSPATPGERATALRQLGQWPESEAALEVLYEGLLSNDPQLCVPASESLAHIGIPAARLLTQRLSNPGLSRENRIWILWSLSSFTELTGTVASDALAKCAQSSDDELALRAILALAAVDENRAETFRSRVARDYSDQPTVQQLADQALTALGH